MKEAIEGDLSEVQMGQLAQQKGQSQDVKQFGQMLQQDHSQHLQQAQQVGVTAPTQPNSKHKALHDRLSKMSGAQFDKAFAKDMVQDHRADIAKYEKAAKSKGTLANFAQQTVPVLQKHLQTAQSIQSARATVGSGKPEFTLDAIQARTIPQKPEASTASGCSTGLTAARSAASPRSAPILDTPSAG